ncbi:hypothetical protein H9L01_10250 [Erysipelothrix inopinata]|uniref:Uncharacterized protein n=1 Tax=Erysipelothrix inopinata TaxID=225084 RepID=A0A7G9RYQ4_9FIRM|nr:hypothetical protein [Erysipelothrix inopinata]QNN60729.1 hypothetical protein H9L01_10250 [Erysipelothrix inopinata]
MPYTIEKISLDKTWLAVMEMTIPDFSRELDLKALNSLRKELVRQNVKLRSPEYNFTIGYDSENRVELVDIKLFVAVENPGNDSQIIKFIQTEPRERMIRVIADTFEDVHIGIAEWLHDNDYIADGDLRRVLVEDENKFVFDCPYKDSEE